jgi:uncharacterized iron-regulated membrane protein
MRFWYLRLHRWVALLFALPLLFVLGTGLVLSFEPWVVVRAIEPGSLTAARVDALLSRHDPAGQARAISFRSYDKTLTIGGRGSARLVDIATGAALPGPSAVANLFVTMRQVHERLLFDLGWLVIASSYVMLALATLGVLMGWPRIRNTLAGWHKAMAWGLLPLIVLSPLTGLFLAYGVTFAAMPAAAPGPPLPLKDAVQIVGARHDLSSLVWLRPLGPRLVVRLAEAGEFKTYAVTREGTVPLPRNWPRLWHEGNFAGAWSALMNVVVSIAMVGLLVTGVWIWLRRQLARRARARQARAAEVFPAAP